MRPTIINTLLLAAVSMVSMTRGAFGFAPSSPASTTRSVVSRQRRQPQYHRHDRHCYSTMTELSLAPSIQPPDLNSINIINQLPTLLNGVIETFDGSSIVDPVVVSDAFWTTLGAKITSLILGQLLATIVFTMVLSLAATQLSGIFDRATKGFVETIFGQSQKKKLRIPNDIDTAVASSQTKPTIDLQKLAICLAIDVLGSSSELLPIVGELTDVFYAPLAATLLRSLFFGSNVVFLLEFGEEILPFTDIIPFATICWVVDTLAPTSGLAKLLQLGDYRNVGSDGKA